MKQAIAEFNHVDYLWDDKEVAAIGDDRVELFLYRSNVLGADFRITNYGGGNTSCKTIEKDPLTNEEVEVMWVNDNKPWIYVVLKRDGVPVLHKIDWTEENKKKMKELQRQIGSSMAQGKFEEKKSNNGESESYHFTPMMDMTEPEEKRGGVEREGVNYTPAQSTAPPTGPGSRPSLETVVDGEAVILPPVVYGPLTEEQSGP